MFKKILVSVLTIGLEIVISIIFAKKADMSFIESAWFIGIFVTFILYWFGSSGGFTTDIMDVNIQGSTGMKMKREDFFFKKGVAFTTSLIFFIVMSIAVWIVYYS